MKKYKFKIDVNVLNHLGIGLYSSTPSILTEIVANAWDADAALVDITIDPSKSEIIIDDDGHGMSDDDIQNKFLNVGYNRRDSEPNGRKTQSGNRFVMGRKGIGKLAMFSLAEQITVTTKKIDTEAISFSFSVKDLLSKIKAGEEYEVLTGPVPSDFKKEKGTRLELRKLNSRIEKTASYLRPRLARRFSVIGNEKGFDVALNGKKITPEDRDFFEDVQFLWYFDEESRDFVVNLAHNLAQVDAATAGEDVVAALDATAAANAEGDAASTTVVEAPQTNTVVAPAIPGIPNALLANKEPCIAQLENEIDVNGQKFYLKGYLATVDKPSKLGKDEESINKIAIFANGRVFQTDILNEVGDARHFNSYIVGEIHADFLDDDQTDRATASREAIKHDDERFYALRLHLRKMLNILRDDWDKWRAALVPGGSETQSAAILEWIAGMKDKRDQKLAERLMASITNNRMFDDESRDAAAKTLLYQSAIAGFEKLRVRRELVRLESVKDIFSPEFLAIFATMDDIEESHFLDITRQRLEVIEKFQSIVDDQSLERVVQEYLFDHLWLLDPSWDRITRSEQMEITLTAELKRRYPDAENGARIDIAYRTSSARHVIVELKKPGRKCTFDELAQQARKYIAATRQYFQEHPDIAMMNGRVPHIDTYILVSEKPQSLLEEDEQSMRISNIQFLTYSGLITNARKAYAEYLSAKGSVSRIEQILQRVRPA
ncbi:ATP-binding protein [Paraburkholderia tropica]|uniref:ATP-binding protein n=1 Tax=Paraburkholderia tropica TaxID=92647 RepID=UPI002AAFAFC8|nr:ATP-binding protein [Paraburkholderia tropica]